MPAASDRALAPDVARGLVLLGIAVANVPFLLWGREVGLLFKLVTDAPADPWVNAAVALLADNRSYLTVAIGCTGGQHRSVYIAERLATYFRAHGNVLVRHRELAVDG